MQNQFKKAFDSYVCNGDTITAEIDGLTITAKIEYDQDAGNPEESDEGFWPKREDYKTAREYKKHYDKASEVLKAWKNDEWFYCGIVLSVTKKVTIPGYVTQTIEISHHAASLWGIECNYPDSDNAYLTEVANDLLPEALTYAKKAMAQAFAPEPRTIKIEVEGGCVQDVHNLPEGWTYEIDDKDILEDA